MNVVFIGAGNLATRLSLEMRKAGMNISQVYSRTKEHAETLADKLGCGWTVFPEKIVDDADLYVFSLKDAVLQEVIARVKPNNGLWVHTAGSMPISVFEGFTPKYGVIYPLQTFSKNREVDFKKIPFFLEANSLEDEKVLEKVARALSCDVRFLSSEKRKNLHLAAVFACNFTNHIYALAEKILAGQQIPREVLLPLIDETAAKVHMMPPAQAQTGPAIRYDENVINKHMAMLEDPDMRDIYELISRSIHKEARHE
ncbi:DUF2520 domain-containing protein [uncultured Parabacteroides sp.]|uniref:Rossmann-like and DUF2520 domain-containing protein n=1 Tax=uncultured Parabacteroides sp. TaxID=512312 RepID=UPI002637CE44|nr:DUF2520 domain-containing protein [uncultured Parabacteroides sp.]